MPDSYVATLRGPSADEAEVHVDFYIDVHVVCHAPVTVKQFDLTVVCIGPGVTASAPYLKLTGWDPTQPKRIGSFHVKAKLSGRFGLEATSSHARVGVEGNVVVSSPLWGGEDRFLAIPKLSEHCLLLNEIPAGRRLLAEVANRTTTFTTT